MRPGLLSELSAIGYKIFLEGETIRLRYQKSDTPPESARHLIDELRKYKDEAVNILKMSNTITPSEIVKYEASSQAIWKNPFPIGSSKARRESLHQVMMAVCEKAFDRIAAGWPRGFVSTPEIHAAEIEIERVQTLVLSGKAKIADFRKSAEGWEQVCKKEIGGPKPKNQ